MVWIIAPMAVIILPGSAKKVIMYAAKQRKERLCILQVVVGGLGGWMLDTRCWIQDTGCRRCKMFDIEYFRFYSWKLSELVFLNFVGFVVKRIWIHGLNG